MEELIKIQKSAGGKDIVSARELYQFLGYEHGQFSRWAKSKIVNNKFGIKNEDWIGFDMVVEGNAVVDYALTLNFAKRICQSAQTKKGEEVRNYFIECERLSKQPIQQATTQQLPTDFISALEQLILSKKSELVLEEKVKELEPKGEFYDTVIDAKGTFDFREATAILKLSYGRTKLFEKLRVAKILQPDNIPYRKFIDSGFFQVFERTWKDKEDAEHLTTQTRFTQKGIDWVIKNRQSVL